MNEEPSGGFKGYLRDPDWFRGKFVMHQLWLCKYLT